jgi:hypothetical protein
MPTPETPPAFKYKTKGRPHLATICAALEKANGLISPAAQLLSMDPSNLRKYAQHHPKCMAVIIEARAKMKDFAESQTFSLMRDRHWGALQYFLSTQCQDRGYVVPKGTALGGEMNSTMVIGSVTINAITPDHFFDENGRLMGPGGEVIESDERSKVIELESVDGEVHGAVKTKKLD